MSAPNSPPEIAFPLVVNEAQRHGYDLTTAPLGRLVLERAQGIEMPALADVIVRPPLDLLHDEFRAVDLMSRGLDTHSVRRALIIGETAVYKAIRGARQKFAARTDAQTTRKLMDIGLLTPLPTPPGEILEDLTPGEFVVISLGSRGWRVGDMANLRIVRPNAISTYLKRARRKLGAGTNEHAVRRALSVGILAFDRMLV